LKCFFLRRSRSGLDRRWWPSWLKVFFVHFLRGSWSVYEKTVGVGFICCWRWCVWGWVVWNVVCFKRETWSEIGEMIGRDWEMYCSCSNLWNLVGSVDFIIFCVALRASLDSFGVSSYF
jgi:hypothetical protein